MKISESFKSHLKLVSFKRFLKKVLNNRISILNSQRIQNKQDHIQYGDASKANLHPEQFE